MKANFCLRSTKIPAFRLELVHVPNGRSKELDSELEAEVDAGAFAGNDPNIDTDGMYYNKSTGDYIKPVEYDKRKIGHTDKYNPGRVVQKPEETDYEIYDDPDEITDKPDPEYDEYLKSQKTYHDPAPGLADIDPDDPNIEWFD